MKITFTFITLLIITTIFAQSPEKMSYQAVIRDASNNLITNTTIGMQVSILKTTANGISEYTETHSTTTNDNGLVSIEIGTGVTTDSFSSINWGNDIFFVKTETDPTGGTSYTISATNQLLSVPYALHANTADSVINNPSFLYLRKKATIQSISTGTNTGITNYDNISSSQFTLNNNTGVITFNKTGNYIITAHTSFLANNPGRKIIWFDCISNYHPGRIASNEADGIANRLTTSFLGRFDAGDEINFRVYQNTGVTTNCPNTSQAFDETQVNIKRLD
jgi:hypothetical protein